MTRITRYWLAMYIVLATGYSTITLADNATASSHGEAPTTVPDIELIEPPEPPLTPEEEAARAAARQAEENARWKLLIPDNRDLPAELQTSLENEKARVETLDKTTRQLEKIQKRLTKLESLKDVVADRQQQWDDRKTVLKDRLALVQAHLDTAQETDPDAKARLQGEAEKLERKIAKADEKLTLLETKIEKKDEKIADQHDKLSRLMAGEDVPDDPNTDASAPPSTNETTTDEGTSTP